jgi:hypothetical protein
MKTKTKSQPTSVDTGMVPVFAYAGDELVDMGMVAVEEYESGLWRSLPGPAFSNLPAPITRLVLEMPNGCLETYLYAFTGDSVVFVSGQGTSWYRCHR